MGRGCDIPSHMFVDFDFRLDERRGRSAFYATTGKCILHQMLPDPLRDHALLTAREARAAPRFFSDLLVFDFYDGVEGGLGITPTGACYRFSALGDSRSGSFRAFWLARLVSDREMTAHMIGEGFRFIAQDQYDAICAARTSGDFICIGHPYLDWLVAEQTVDPSVFVESGGGFQAAHHALRSKFKCAGQPPR